jgi:hypothetical protein
MRIQNHLLAALLFALSTNGFSHRQYPSSSTVVVKTYMTLAFSSSSSIEEKNDSTERMMVVRSPLRFLGPYPTIPLRFPNLATPSQRQRNVSGVSLDWVLDTAANVNTINAQVAKELALAKVGVAPGGVGAAGDIVGGDTFLLGDCELDIPRDNKTVDQVNDANNVDDDNSNNEFVFMKGLTASALPVASPAAAGLLGLAFFYCFEGGVEFRWGIASTIETSGDKVAEFDDDDRIPSVMFHRNDEGLRLDGLTRVPFESLPGSMLPAVTLYINGKEIPALFDTGSPITVFNSCAAEEAGIDTVISLDNLNPEKAGWNPFSKISRVIAAATSKGDILTIAGIGGAPIRLVRSTSPVNFNILESSRKPHPLSSARVYVGDLPGLAALGGLGGGASPAVVLGMDLISTRQRLIFRARQCEIYL